MSGVSNIHASRAASPDVAMSPQLILAMARQRVTSTDRQIDQVTRDIESSTRMADELSQKLAALQQVEALAQRDGDHVIYTDGAGEKIFVGADYPGADSEGFMTVDQYLDAMGVADLVPHGDPGEGGQPTMSLANIEAAVRTLKTELQRQNSGNELRMIELQTLMQQRSEAITMATNLLKDHGDTKDRVLNNLV